ncbi:MAG: endonuclease dU [Candidatus Hodarchaeales archaeon]
MLESIRQWRSIKSKTPIIGIDDGGFDRFSEEKQSVPVFGVVMKGAAYVDGIIQTQLERDDTQATQILTDMILASSHKLQIRAILLQGITIAGFGVIDIHRLWDKTNIPVIVVLRKFPNYEKIHSALEKVFDDGQDRWLMIKKAGEPQNVQTNPQIFLQIAGITLPNAFQLIKKCTAVGTIPEALRIAHLIGASRYRFLTG